jgi:hypothetical protein
LESDFIHDPEQVLDVSCMADYPEPAFVLPEDIYIAPDINKSGDEINLGAPQGIPWLEAIAAASILILLGSALALLAGGVWWLLAGRGKAERSEPSARIAYGTALFGSIVALASPILLTMINSHYLDSDPLMRAFGVGRDYLPSTLLAIASVLTGLLFLALLVLTIWGWARRRWSLRLRLVVSLVTLASLPMVALGIHWDTFTMLF